MPDSNAPAPTPPSGAYATILQRLAGIGFSSVEFSQIPMTPQVVIDHRRVPRSRVPWSPSVETNAASRHLRQMGGVFCLDLRTGKHGRA